MLAGRARTLLGSARREQWVLAVWLVLVTAARSARSEPGASESPAAEPPPAPADSAILVAQQSFQLGRERLAAGQLREACEHFADSQRAYSSAVTLLNLGNCYERGDLEGGLSAALRALERAGAEAEQVFDREMRQRIRDEAARRAGEIRARVPRLTLRSSATRGARVTVNGESFEQLDVAVPMNPGRYELELRAASKKPYRQDFELSEGVLLQIVLPELSDALPPASSPAGEDHGAAAGQPRRFGSAPFWLGGAAAVVGGVWLYTGLESSANDAEYSKLWQQCEAGCPPETRERMNDARGRAKDFAVATDFVVLPLFAATLGTALVLWWLDDFALGDDTGVSSAVSSAVSPAVSSAVSSRVHVGCRLEGCTLGYSGQF